MFPAILTVLALAAVGATCGVIWFFADLLGTGVRRVWWNVTGLRRTQVLVRYWRKEPIGYTFDVHHPKGMLHGRCRTLSDLRPRATDLIRREFGIEKQGLQFAFFDEGLSP